MNQATYDVIEYLIMNKESLRAMMDMANITNPKPIIQNHLIHMFTKKDLTAEDIYVSMDHQVVEYLLKNYFGGNSDENKVHSEE